MVSDGSLHQIEYFRKRSNEIATKYPGLISACFFVFLALGLIYIKNIPCLEGDDLICLSTIFLGITTIYLSLTGMQSAEKERKRLRLKEKLEGLYSPLRAEEEKILHIKVYGYQLINDNLKLIFDHHIHKIEFLASDNLKKEIYRLYYENLELSQDRWNDYIDNLIIIIKDDVKSLLEEYNKLTFKR